MTGDNFNVKWAAPKTPKTMRITINQIGTSTIAYDYARQEGDGMCTSQETWSNRSLHRDTIQVPAGHVEANVAPNNQINITTRNVKNFSVWVDSRM